MFACSGSPRPFVAACVILSISQESRPEGFAWLFDLPLALRAILLLTTYRTSLYAVSHEKTTSLVAEE
jgi:hypothetical protein